MKLTLEQRKKTEPVLCWILAMILCPLGVCFAAKSNFGVSMIEAPVYILHLKLSEFWPWYTFGTSEYFVQAALLLLMCLIIRKFRWKYLLSFGTAFVYGRILDGWNRVFRGLPADTLFQRIVLAVVSCIIIAFAVALFFRTSLPLEVWELFVKEVAVRYRLKISRVKWVFDFSLLGSGILLMFLFFGRFRLDAIGIATVATTFINVPLIVLCSKVQNRIWDRFAEPIPVEIPE